MGARLRRAIGALLIIVGLSGAVALALRGASDVQGVSFSGHPKPLSNDKPNRDARLREHVATITTHERNVPDSPQHLEAAPRYSERQLTALG